MFILNCCSLLKINISTVATTETAPTATMATTATVPTMATTEPMVLTVSTN